MMILVFILDIELLRWLNFMLSIKKYLKSLIYKFKSKIDIDSDFYGEYDFVLYDLEG